MRVLRTLAVATLLLCLGLAAAPRPLTLTIRVLMGTQPFQTRAYIHVEPHEANRHLCLSWTQIKGGGQQRTSCQELMGEQAARGYWQDLKGLTAGKWDVVAAVIRKDDTRVLSNRLVLTVIGPGYEMDPDF